MVVVGKTVVVSGVVMYFAMASVFGLPVLTVKERAPGPAENRLEAKQDSPTAGTHYLEESPTGRAPQKELLERVLHSSQLTKEDGSQFVRNNKQIVSEGGDQEKGLLARVMALSQVRDGAERRSESSEKQVVSEVHAMETNVVRKRRTPLDEATANEQAGEQPFSSSKSLGHRQVLRPGQASEDVSPRREVVDELSGGTDFPSVEGFVFSASPNPSDTVSQSSSGIRRSPPTGHPVLSIHSEQGLSHPANSYSHIFQQASESDTTSNGSTQHHTVHTQYSVFFYLDVYHSIWDYLKSHLELNGSSSSTSGSSSSRTSGSSSSSTSGSSSSSSNDAGRHRSNFRGSRNNGKGGGLLIAFGGGKTTVEVSMVDFNVTEAMLLVFSMDHQTLSEELHVLRHAWTKLTSQFPPLDVPQYDGSRMVRDTGGFAERVTADDDAERLRHQALAQMTQNQKEYLLHFLGGIMQNLRDRAEGTPTHDDNFGVADICCVVG